MAGIFDLFRGNLDYPDKELLLNGVPIGMVFNYVSSTYLNGFINYVEVKTAILIQRYWEEEEHGPWDKFVEKTVKIAGDFHTNYSNIEDDVLILAESESSWWFFWNDRDCSDCCIGRLDKNEISFEDLNKSLIHFIESKINSTSDITGVYAVLPKPKGWISF